MLNFVTVRIFFAASFLVAVFLDWKFSIPFWSYIVFAAIFIAINVYGSYFIQSGFFIRALCKGDPDKKTIAITFDDGPVSGFTSALLDLLKKENVPAAFFLIGINVERNKADVKRMNDEGHVIGNHSFTHSYWFSLNNSSTMLKDLQQCDKKIVEAIGKQPKMFRPPYGVTNPMVKKAVEQGNYTCIGWSVRTYDSVAKSGEQLLTKSLKNLQNGDVILFHDWGQHTIGILADFIKEVRARGFEIVRLDRLLNTPPYR